MSIAAQTNMDLPRSRRRRGRNLDLRLPSEGGWGPANRVSGLQAGIFASSLQSRFIAGANPAEAIARRAIGWQ
jgi:hypothetical protein